MQHVLPSLRPQSMGVSVPRAEDPRLLTGSGEFVADVSLPGVLHAAFVRSPHAHAQITAVETDSAGKPAQSVEVKAGPIPEAELATWSEEKIAVRLKELEVESGPESEEGE